MGKNRKNKQSDNNSEKWNKRIDTATKNAGRAATWGGLAVVAFDLLTRIKKYNSNNN